MAVYTRIERQEVESLLLSYGLPDLVGMEPIEAGTENTNYVIRSGSKGAATRYVLTLFEEDPADWVLQTAILTRALSELGTPCPAPLRRRDTGAFVSELRGKPAWLVPFVEGRGVLKPAGAQLEAMGRALAAFHAASTGLPFSRSGAHLAAVLCPLARELADDVAAREPKLASLLRDEASEQERLPEAELPAGIIHGDCFFDNVIFDENEAEPAVRAFLDFHLAGRGPWLFDVAVALLDGACEGARVSGDRVRALLGGYRALRPLDSLETHSLEGYLRRAALRFLCLRVRRNLTERRSRAAGIDKDPWQLVALLEALGRERKAG